MTMKSREQRIQIVESAIQLLKTGIKTGQKSTILDAYSMVEAKGFSWDNLDTSFMEWDNLIDEANNIIYL